MSNIIVRNIVGDGVFDIPTNDAELNAASDAFATILDGIADFTYETCLAQIIEVTEGSQELSLIIDQFTYDGSWFTTSIGLLRATIETALTDHANISSVGNTDINVVEPKALYTYVPQVERVDNWNGYIYFKDEVPPGAQIEVYRFARRDRGQIHGDPGPYTRIGKRWRPDQLLGVGALSFNAGIYQKHPLRGRTHFRFAYRWPATPGTAAPAPGIRGPLSAFTISTANPRERTHGSRLVIVASPSGFGNENS